MTTMNLDDLQNLGSFFTKISSWQGIFLLGVALCIFGYVLKGLPFVKNDFIPAIVIVAGAVLNPFVSSPAEGLHNPTLTLALQGFIAGALAWILHNQVLSRFIDPKLFKGSTPTVILLLTLIATSAATCRSPGQAAYRTVAATSAIADKSLLGWKDYVDARQAFIDQRQVEGANPEELAQLRDKLERDELPVRKAWSNFQSVRRTSRAAVIAYLDNKEKGLPADELALQTAIDALDAAKNELLTIIKQLSK